jgi:hypothetical protein
MNTLCFLASEDPGAFTAPEIVGAVILALIAAFIIYFCVVWASFPFTMEKKLAAIEAALIASGKATEKAVRDLEAQARWLNEYTFKRDGGDHGGAQTEPATTRQQEKPE